MSRLSFAAFLLPAALLAQSPTWSTDFAAAKAQAAKEKKLLLADFTGSVWCPYCVLLEKEVLTSPAFGKWASKVVLVKLDFPVRGERTPEKIKANPTLGRLMELKDQHKISGFPTVILFSSDGTELNRLSGYSKGMGPEAWLAQLEKKAKS